MAINTPKSLSLNLNTNYQSFGTVPAGKTWTIVSAVAANSTYGLSSLSANIRYLDASNSNTPVQLVNAVQVANSTSVSLLAGKVVLEAGDSVQGYANNFVLGQKMGSLPLSPTSLAYDGTKFVAGGSTTTGRVMYSIDKGTTWTIVDLGVAKTMSAVTYGNGTWVLHDGSNFWSSTDGINWTIRTAATFTTCRKILWIPFLSMFIAVGSGGNIWTSPDGTTWTSRTSGVTTELWGIATDGTKVLVTGTTGATNVVSLTSTNGTSWTNQTTSVAGSSYCAYWSASYNAFLVGIDGKVYSTTDGITYTLRVTTGASIVGSILINGSETVIIGLSGAVYVMNSLTGGAVSFNSMSSQTYTTSSLVYSGVYYFLNSSDLVSITSTTPSGAQNFGVTLSIVETTL